MKKKVLGGPQATPLLPPWSGHILKTREDGGATTSLVLPRCTTLLGNEVFRNFSVQVHKSQSAAWITPLIKQEKVTHMKNNKSV